MTHRRHMYFTEGLLDLNKMLAEARAYAREGGTVVVHHHPYRDLGYDGCPLPLGWIEAAGHDVFRGEAK